MLRYRLILPVNNMIKYKSTLKIFIVLTLSYLASGLLVRNAFIANTPRLRQDFGPYISLKFTNFFAGLFKSKQFPEVALQSQPLQLVSKGVYAKSDGTNSYTLIKVGEVEWVEYTYNIDGKEIKIRVPKGQKQLSQEQIRDIYK